MSSRETLLAALGCATFAALVLFEALFGGRSTQSFDHRDPRIDMRPWAQPDFDLSVPMNKVTPDLDAYVLPGLMRMQQMLARGAGPWWDDAQLLGYPLAANLPYPIFNPLAWLFLPMEAVTALDGLLWLHLALGAFLAFRTTRLLGARPAAAAFGAVGFCLSAWMFTRWHEGLILYSTAWWPGLVGAVEWMRRARFRRAALEGSLCGGMALLAGFPQVGVYALCGFFALVLMHRQLRTARALGVALGVLVLSLLLAGPQLAVSGAAYAESLRSSPETTASTAQRGLPAAAALGVLLPEALGRPTDFSDPTSEPAAWLPMRRWIASPEHTQDNLGELGLYPGILVLLLLPLCLRLRGWARRLTLLALAALLGSLVWPLAVQTFPALSRLAAGNMKRVLVLFAGSLPLAGALALQHLIDHGAARTSTAPNDTDAERATRSGWGLSASWGALLLALLVALPAWAAQLNDPQAAAFAQELGEQGWRQATRIALGIFALGLIVRGRRARSLRWALILPALLLAVDLGQQARAFNPFQEQRPAYPSTPALELLGEREGRVAVFGSLNVLPPMAAAVHGVRSLHGALAMVPRRSAELLACLEGPLLNVHDPRVARPLESAASFDHPLLDLLGVDTVVIGDEAWAARLARPLLFRHDAEGLAALDRPSAGPRAFLCGGADVVPSAEQRLARLASREFPVHATVLLEQDPGLALPTRGEQLAVEVSSELPGRMSLSLDAPFAGVLVVTESWDPGWRAEEQGRELELLVADHALLGIALEPGAHEIELVYRPPGLISGVLAAAAALVALLLIAFWPRGGRSAPADAST